jgi:hypothetical protein
LGIAWLRILTVLGSAGTMLAVVAAERQRVPQ